MPARIVRNFQGRAQSWRCMTEAFRFSRRAFFAAIAAALAWRPKPELPHAYAFTQADVGALITVTGGILRPGDRFTITGVYAVNPPSRQLRGFTVDSRFIYG